MNESDPLPPFKSIPLPKLFQPFLEDHPFERCIVCDCDLLQDNLHYLIEKAYKGTEVIFEYALCVSCAMAMRAELSQESLQRMQDQFENSQNLEARRTRLAKLPPQEIEPWVDTCVITGTSRKETDSAYSKNKLGSAGRAGLGAWMGFFLGTVAKIAIGVTMMGTFILFRLF